MDSVMEEVEYLVARKHISGLKLFDSTFTADRAHVESFCKHIAGYKLPWECEVRADTVDAPLSALNHFCCAWLLKIAKEYSSA